jgi:CDP-diacylglycerol--serine O-phosphatidyltransferase
MKTHIPNVLTLGNLICGCIGITFAFSGNLEFASYLIWIGAVFDFFDGFLARLLNVKSLIGKELDSLADMVSFGVLPSVIMFILVTERNENTILPFITFSIAAFAALRLAKFNTDESQTDSFLGLPTPANAFFISSLPLILSNNAIEISDHTVSIVLVAIALILSFLMVSGIPMFSLKFKDLSWRHNNIRYIFAIISLILLIWMNISAIPLIIIAYILLSAATRLISSTK